MLRKDQVEVSSDFSEAVVTRIETGKETRTEAETETSTQSDKLQEGTKQIKEQMTKMRQARTKDQGH